MKTIHPLSPRELQVLELVAKGQCDKEIAARLGISRRTVSNHVSSLLVKLNAETRTAAAVIAVQGGLVNSH